MNGKATGNMSRMVRERGLKKAHAFPHGHVDAVFSCVRAGVKVTAALGIGGLAVRAALKFMVGG